jgi:hypothetical protein
MLFSWPPDEDTTTCCASAKSHCLNNSTAFPSFLDTYATRLLAEPLLSRIYKEDRRWRIVKIDGLFYLILRRVVEKAGAPKDPGFLDECC